MPQSKRSLQATAALTTSPPITLPINHAIARVIRLAGNNLYHVEFGTPIEASDDKEGLVELPSRFRNAIWLKRGSFVVVDIAALGDRRNKIRGEIVNVVREERVWRRMGWWPMEWAKREEGSRKGDGSDEEENLVGRMPPSESEDDGEEDWGESAE